MRVFHSDSLWNKILLLLTLNIVSARHIRHALNKVFSQPQIDRNLMDSFVLSREQQLMLENLAQLRSSGSPSQTLHHTMSEESHREDMNLTEQNSSEPAGPKPHFMADRRGILLVASQGATPGGQKTLRFTVRNSNKLMLMNEVKLYYHVGAEELHVNTSSEGVNRMVLRLSMLRENQTGEYIADPIESMISINKKLIGWHSQKIPHRFIREAAGKLSPNSVLVLEFILECTNCDYEPFNRNNTGRSAPFIKMNHIQRRRRQNPQNCNGNCCLKELIIDFETLGWNFILHPLSYTANYCDGSCSNPTPNERMTYPSNTNIVNAKLALLGSGSQSTCCGPSDTEPVTVTYMLENGEIKSNNNLRKVKSCRCS